TVSPLSPEEVEALARYSVPRSTAGGTVEEVDRDAAERLAPGVVQGIGQTVDAAADHLAHRQQSRDRAPRRAQLSGPQGEVAQARAALLTEVHKLAREAGGARWLLESGIDLGPEWRADLAERARKDGDRRALS